MATGFQGGSLTDVSAIGVGTTSKGVASPAQPSNTAQILGGITDLVNTTGPMLTKALSEGAIDDLVTERQNLDLLRNQATTSAERTQVDTQLKQWDIKIAKSSYGQTALKRLGMKSTGTADIRAADQADDVASFKTGMTIPGAELLNDEEVIEMGRGIRQAAAKRATELKRLETEVKMGEATDKIQLRKVTDYISQSLQESLAPIRASYAAVIKNIDMTSLEGQKQMREIGIKFSNDLVAAKIQYRKAMKGSIKASILEQGLTEGFKAYETLISGHDAMSEKERKANGELLKSGLDGLKLSALALGNFKGFVLASGGADTIKSLASLVSLSEWKDVIESLNKTNTVRDTNPNRLDGNKVIDKVFKAHQEGTTMGDIPAGSPNNLKAVQGLTVRIQEEYFDRESGGISPQSAVEYANISINTLDGINGLSRLENQIKHFKTFLNPEHKKHMDVLDNEKYQAVTAKVGEVGIQMGRRAASSQNSHPGILSYNTATGVVTVDKSVQEVATGAALGDTVVGIKSDSNVEAVNANTAASALNTGIQAFVNGTKDDPRFSKLSDRERAYIYMNSISNAHQSVSIPRPLTIDPLNLPGKAGEVAGVAKQVGSFTDLIDQTTQRRIKPEEERLASPAPGTRAPVEEVTSEALLPLSTSEDISEQEAVAPFGPLKTGHNAIYPAVKNFLLSTGRSLNSLAPGGELHAKGTEAMKPVSDAMKAAVKTMIENPRDLAKGEKKLIDEVKKSIGRDANTDGLTELFDTVMNAWRGTNKRVQDVKPMNKESALYIDGARNRGISIDDDALKLLTSAIEIAETGGEEDPQRALNPTTSAAGFFQIINGQRKVSAQSVINLVGKDNAPDWVLQAVEPMSDAEHDEFMGNLNREQQETLYLARIFSTKKGGDKILKKWVDSGFDDKVAGEIYQKLHHTQPSVKLKRHFERSIRQVRKAAGA